jgi:hypothetical protein
LFAGYLSAQEKVNYSITEDNPEMHSKFNLNLELFQLDFSTAIIGASSFNVGLLGYYEIMESPLQVE